MRLGGLSRRRKRTGKAAIIMFMLLLCVGIIIAVLIKMQPAFLDYAEKYANNMANNVVNDALYEVFSDDTYANLTEVSDTGVKTIETNTSKVNKLKAELNQTIQNKIKERECETIGVPIGSASDFYFLAGTGPKIPVRIYPVSVVNTDFREEFESAGINHVHHKIYLDVSIEMSFVGVTFKQTETVNTTALISESVIIGDTPQYYGNGLISKSVE